MKLINQSFEILDQEPGMLGMLKHIEVAGRNCYKSEDKITEDSAPKFVDMLISRGHTAMLEHGTIYLQIPGDSPNIDHYRFRYENNPYSRANYVVDDFMGLPKFNDTCPLWVTTNYRVLQERGWLEDLKYLCEPTPNHSKRVTVKYVADIHFYKDATRHRVFSWAIESTRYCNYLASRFGMSVSFMMPTWIKAEDIPDLEEDCKIMESIYFKWINKGYQAQHAAYFLPQGTKAEVIMTGFLDDWKHFFDLRCDVAAHPDVRALAIPLKQEFINRQLI